jgi:flagellar motor switch protein FliN/FliY
MIMGTQDSGSEPVVETKAPSQSASMGSSSMESSVMGSAGYGQAASAYAANGAQRAPSGSVNTPPQAPVEKAVFSSFDQTLSPKSGRNLDLLLDIPLQLTVELGRTKKQIRDILELGSGSIIELDALAGEPVDILVNNKLIARGEVVVIDENFGVRVTDIISPAERIARLQ